MNRPRLSFLQIFNMSFGFLGIQFGFGLQLANMSAIYAKLGAEPSKIPILWLAGPMTGLLVQPIIGSMSDRTWNWLGRRRPYFLVGAILSSIALFFMPDAPALWVAATMLWVLDALDQYLDGAVPRVRRRQAAAGAADDGLRDAELFHRHRRGGGECAAVDFRRTAASRAMRRTACRSRSQYAFKLGAVRFLLAVLWTVFTSKEYPPEDMEEFERAQSGDARGSSLHPMLSARRRGIAGALLGALRAARWWSDHLTTVARARRGAASARRSALVLSGPEVLRALREMPRTMKQLARRAVFHVARTFLHVDVLRSRHGAADFRHDRSAVAARSTKAPPSAGRRLRGIRSSAFSSPSSLPPLAKATSRKTVHSARALRGRPVPPRDGFHPRAEDAVAMHDDRRRPRVGLHPLDALRDALAARCPAARMGVYMGIFNFFIVIPEILASLALEPVVKQLIRQ